MEGDRKKEEERRGKKKVNKSTPNISHRLVNNQQELRVEIYWHPNIIPQGQSISSNWCFASHEFIAGICSTILQRLPLPKYLEWTQCVQACCAIKSLLFVYRIFINGFHNCQSEICAQHFTSLWFTASCQVFVSFIQFLLFIQLFFKWNSHYFNLTVLVNICHQKING